MQIKKCHFLPIFANFQNFTLKLCTKKVGRTHTGNVPLDCEPVHLLLAEQANQRRSESAAPVFALFEAVDEEGRRGPAAGNFHGRLGRPSGDVHARTIATAQFLGAKGLQPAEAEFTIASATESPFTDTFFVRVKNRGNFRKFLKTR